jgi:hypothetical protein
VAPIYNLSYLGGGDQEELSLRPYCKKVSETHISINKLDMVVCACGSSYVGGINRKIEVHVSSWQKHEPLFKI